MARWRGGREEIFLRVCLCHSYTGRAPEGMAEMILHSVDFDFQCERKNKKHLPARTFWCPVFSHLFLNKQTTTTTTNENSPRGLEGRTSR